MSSLWDMSCPAVIIAPPTVEDDLGKAVSLLIELKMFSSDVQLWGSRPITDSILAGAAGEVLQSNKNLCWQSLMNNTQMYDLRKCATASSPWRWNVFNKGPVIDELHHRWKLIGYDESS